MTSIQIVDIGQKQGKQGDDGRQPAADQEDHAGAKRLSCPTSQRQADWQKCERAQRVEAKYLSQFFVGNSRRFRTFEDNQVIQAGCI